MYARSRSKSMAAATFPNVSGGYAYVTVRRLARDARKEGFLAKPKSEMSEADLFKWFTINRRTSKMNTLLGGSTHRRSEMKQATVWGLHQFDVRVLQAALCGQKILREKRHHVEGTLDLYWVVLETRNIAENHKASIIERERAIRRIREWQLICARCNEVLLAERGDGTDGQQDSEGDDTSGLVAEEEPDGQSEELDDDRSSTRVPEEDDGLDDETPRFDDDVRIG